MRGRQLGRLVAFVGLTVASPTGAQQVWNFDNKGHGMAATLGQAAKQEVPSIGRGKEAIPLSSGVETRIGNLDSKILNRALSDAGIKNEEGSVAERLEREIGKVIAASMPSVVKVQHGYVIGSGFFVDYRGYIVTNYHVVDWPGQDAWVTVTTHDGSLLAGKVIAVDKPRDLALIKLQESNRAWRTLKVDERQQVFQGKFAIALGHPYGVPFSSSFGIVTGVNRSGPGTAMYVQTDACINPGNSGGPLMSVSGTVMGINTWIITSSGGCDGVGFAISATDVKAFLDLAMPQGMALKSGL